MRLRTTIPATLLILEEGASRLCGEIDEGVNTFLNRRRGDAAVRSRLIANALVRLLR
jgi:hypothetical protein